MPIKGDCSELLTVLSGAQGSPDSQDFQGIEFSSLEIKPGDIFIALKGANVHGQQFIAEAFSKGAAVAIVEDLTLLTGEFKNRLICVPDTYQALTELAAWWRAKLRAKCLAITGSVGKTTVKELCGELLKSAGKGAYARKSFNNHIGVPYTICQVDEDADWMVCEIGMNHPGEIEPLTKLTRPDVAVVTAVGPAHIEFFEDGIEGIAKEKLSIAEGLSGGELVLNGDSPDIRQAVLRYRDRPIRYFGETSDAVLQIRDVKLGELSEATLDYNGRAYPLKLKLPGRGNVWNGACALLACLTLFPSLEIEKLLAALESVSPPPMRLNVALNSRGQKIVDDGYNANPVSMLNALDAIEALLEPGDKLCCVLGEMRELGTHSRRYHREIGVRLSKMKQLTEIVAIGRDAIHYLEPVPDRVKKSLAYEIEAAKQAVLESDATVFLLKSSRGGGKERLLEPIVRALLNGD
jgi:UDP-N-acetylmuramoyl-tripeptide--D-alanyl-D-alanine ligase